MYPFESQTPLNGFNYTVPNYNFTPYVQPTIPQQQVRQNSSIVWVQGEHYKNRGVYLAVCPSNLIFGGQYVHVERRYLSRSPRD